MVLARLSNQPETLTLQTQAQNRPEKSRTAASDGAQSIPLATVFATGLSNWYDGLLSSPMPTWCLTSSLAPSWVAQSGSRHYAAVRLQYRARSPTQLSVGSAPPDDDFELQSQAALDSGAHSICRPLQEQRPDLNQQERPSHQQATHHRPCCNQ